MAGSPIMHIGHLNTCSLKKISLLSQFKVANTHCTKSVSLKRVSAPPLHEITSKRVGGGTSTVVGEKSAAGCVWHFK